jgi:hypothetical protein
MATGTVLKKARSRKRGITSTEENILRAVGDLGVATAADITRMLYKKGSTSYVRTLMKDLAEGTPRYLFRFGIGMQQAPGNFERLYMLTRRGRDFLLTLGVDVHVWYRPHQASNYSFSFLKHHHGVTQFIVATHLFVRTSPEYHLRQTRTGFALVSNPPSFPLDTSGKETRSVVIPDVWMHLERETGDPSEPQNFYLWVEIDRGTESKKKYSELLRNRINFVRRKGYEAFFGTPSIIFVYLAIGTTTDYRLHRLHTLREWTADTLSELNLDDWSPLFRFSTIDECLYDSLILFTDPVFCTPDSDTLVHLFPPQNEQEEKTHGHQNQPGHP